VPAERPFYLTGKNVSFRNSLTSVHGAGLGWFRAQIRVFSGWTPNCKPACMDLTVGNRGQSGEALFSDAFRRGFSLTVGFLQSRGADCDTAEEVAQAAWTRGWEMRHQIVSENSVVSWINTIAKNKLQEAWKRQSRFVVLTENTATDSPADQSADPASQGVDLSRALKSVESTDRRILVLFYKTGLSTEEIARQLSLSHTAVRIRMCRARQRLRSKMPSIHRPMISSRSRKVCN
jgi:RNA polymerase sigma-70 factor (ECF subfamily)